MAAGTHYNMEAAAVVGHAGYVCVDGLGRRERTRNRYASSSAMYGTLSPASHASQGFSPGRWLRGEGGTEDARSPGRRDGVFETQRQQRSEALCCRVTLQCSARAVL